MTAPIGHSIELYAMGELHLVTLVQGPPLPIPPFNTLRLARSSNASGRILCKLKLGGGVQVCCGRGQLVGERSKER
jgi:hypothetical protein